MGGRFNTKHERVSLTGRVTGWCVFLIGGAMVNVVAAWACVAATDPAPKSVEQASIAEILVILDSAAREEVLRWQEYVGESNAHVWVTRQFGVQRMRCHLCAGLPCAYNATCAGIPLSALAGWSLDVSSREQRRSGLWTAKIGQFDPHDLPLLPVWPGFAINSVLYAAILWLMVIAVLVPIRRRRVRQRLRRWLCPTCAYPIGSSPVCTECGTPLPQPIEPIG